MMPPIQDASEKERMDGEDRPETKTGGWHRLMLLHKNMHKNNENDGKFLRFIIKNGINEPTPTGRSGSYCCQGRPIDARR